MPDYGGSMTGFSKLALSKGILNSFIAILLSFSSFAYAGAGGTQGKFPTTPDPVMTPGKMCEFGIKRYPEGITYCERNVTSDEKRKIISDYDAKLGFKIRTMNRGDFKIDHFIPLSIGGANDIENLWPQHKSVYAYSDPLEEKVFNLMNAAKIKQVEAIRVIKECKLNLGRCAELSDYLDGLMRD